MTDRDPIDTPENLEAWLEALPRDTPEAEERARRIAVTIAFRAAARVFPFVAGRLPLESDKRHKSDLSVLSIYRPLTISSVALDVETETIASAASFAYRTAADAADAADGVDAADAAAADASDAASIACTLSASSVGKSVSFAAKAATSSFVAFASALKRDSAESSAMENLAAVPLWPDDNPLAEVWEAGRARLEAAQDDWSPVIEWYEHVLDPKGRALDLDMMRDIALIDPKIWDAGPSEALPVIGEIWRRGRLGTSAVFDALRDTSDGIVVEQNLETERFFQSDIPAENGRRLASGVAKLREVLAVADSLDNMRGTLRMELLWIRRAVENHSEGVVVVHNNARAARLTNMVNVRSGVCPTAEEDAFVGILQGTLLEVERSLEDEPEVVESRGEAPVIASLIDDPAQVALLGDAAEVVADASEGTLAEELPELAQLATDAQTPAPIRQGALKRIGSVILQVWIIGNWRRFKGTLKEIEDVSGRMARISTNVGVIAASSGVVYTALHSEKVAAAVKVILALF
ncbi:hypothetical protein [Jannaschia sp. M317]|uniref:hypothetical protein n=1 Tax=Jannaschia sp. M317 TaxID=2867011 RepID=UPI0021A85056|nr:hypothetical protein [Jannaschia sp. M317]UWQ17179.1 hypothetical protein K3551_14995 [Jannaschia sp. M317]